MIPRATPFLRRAAIAIATACAIPIALTACKNVINPSVPPEGDADIPVALAEADLRRSRRPAPATNPAFQQITITINNAPGPDRPLEIEVMQRLVDLFERRNPGIRVQFSPWRFTPESFFERLANRTLTDIIEINAAQLPAILAVNGAADLTENVALHPEVRLLNPAALSLAVRDNRFYGIPGELHTLALFYNRRLFHNAISSRLSPSTTPTTSTPNPAASNRRRGRGAPEQDIDDPPPAHIQALLDRANADSAQIPLQTRIIAQQEEERPRRGFFRNWFRATREEEPPRPAPTPIIIRQTPRPRKTPDPAAQFADGATPDTIPGSATTAPSDPNQRVEIRLVDPPTPMVAVAGLPRTREEFTATAVRLTDHRAGVFGYAPVLFSRDGGREFAQWAIQSGLSVMSGARGDDLTLDVNSATAASVVQFLKDLKWRYDVSPPAEMCFRDNLVRLFAQGRLAMMMLPTDPNTINTILKLGMPLEDLGIAPLPAGPRNRRHIAIGSYYIINSQIDSARRAAAFKWLLFLNDPETLQIRQQYLHQEGELTGAPAVARFTAARQAAIRESMRRTMRVPIFLDYDDAMADSAQLALEPPHFTERFFESLAADIRPIIEKKDSDPARETARVGADFIKRFVQEPATTQGAARYLELLRGVITAQNLLPITAPGPRHPPTHNPPQNSTPAEPLRPKRPRSFAPSEPLRQISPPAPLSPLRLCGHNVHVVHPVHLYQTQQSLTRICEVNSCWWHSLLGSPASWDRRPPCRRFSPATVTTAYPRP